MNIANNILENYRNLISKYSDDEEIKIRYKRNILRMNIDLDLKNFWHKLVTGIVSSQNSEKNIAS